MASLVYPDGAVKKTTFMKSRKQDSVNGRVFDNGHTRSIGVQLGNKINWAVSGANQLVNVPARMAHKHAVG